LKIHRKITRGKNPTKRSLNATLKNKIIDKLLKIHRKNQENSGLVFKS